VALIETTRRSLLIGAGAMVAAPLAGKIAPAADRAIFNWQGGDLIIATPEPMVLRTIYVEEYKDSFMSSMLRVREILDNVPDRRQALLGPSPDVLFNFVPPPADDESQ
jgi:hypothetical protein